MLDGEQQQVSHVVRRPVLVDDDVLSIGLHPNFKVQVAGEFQSPLASLFSPPFPDLDYSDKVVEP